jgi:hypothetical protein
LRGGESISTIVGFGDLMSLFLKHKPTPATDAGVIVNNRDLGRARRLPLAPETSILIRSRTPSVGNISHFRKDAGGMIEHLYGDSQATYVKV